MIQKIQAGKSKKEATLTGGLLKKIAPKINAKVLLDPEWGYAGQIIFQSNKKSYFRGGSLDLNPVGAASIANDKGYANFFMKQLGYRTVPHSKVFYSTEWGRAIGKTDQGVKAAVLHAKAIGFPVIVKPNDGSQGRGVAKVSSERELRSALKNIFSYHNVAIVEQLVRGRDYRVVVLDDQVIAAYERIPLSVVGDGKRTIAQLLTLKQKQHALAGRGKTFTLTDRRIVEKLVKRRLSLQSVLPTGESLALLASANLSTGGESVDVTGTVAPKFAQLAVALTKDMGLRLCGVDLMIDGNISVYTKKNWILEINAAPGLEHYAKSGPAQAQLVEDLYTKILKKLEEGHL